MDSNDLVRIKFLRGMVLSGCSYNRGEEAAFPRSLADRLIESNIARPVLLKRSVSKGGASGG